jgi:hypothetical protein
MMTPLDYLDHEEAFSYVVASAWLFCPETAEYRGCVFLKDRFDQERIDEWFRNLSDDPAQVEAMVNQTRLYDLFASCDGEQDDDLKALARGIGECWQGILLARYPGRGLTVEVSGDQDGSHGPTITFWTDTDERGR